MRKKYKIIILIIVFTFSSMIIPSHNFSIKKVELGKRYGGNTPHYSGETVFNKEWLKNNDFSTQDNWFSEKGGQGDNTTVDASISSGQANYKVIGENNTFEVLAGQANSSTWFGWGIYNNSDFLLPDVAEINATGGYVYHYLDESENGGAGQVHNFPSVHFRKNVSLPEDISDYNIINASLEVIFNATVESTVDAPGDTVGQSAIWDSATFYVEIADLNLSYSFRVGENKTTTLGQDSPSILNITDRELTYVSENDLITALNLALDKDPSHSDFTIILGIDIYCEDNDFPDLDEWSALIFKSFNLTFSYERNVDKFSSVSWNQIGNQITGSNIQVTNANLTFKYKIDQNWTTALSPYSEIRILINNNLHPETVRLSTALTTFQDAKVDGFDVTNLILKNVNITISIQVFIANTFELGQNITISIDDIFLNITYVETFSDFETQAYLFLNNENKTSDPFIQLPIENNLNITIKFLDNQTLTHISGATVQLEGKLSGNLNENTSLGLYSIIVNTTNLGIGLWFLNIRSQKNNYVSKLIPFYINVIERPTDFKIFVDSEEKTTNNTVKIKSNEFMNISVIYKDNSSKKHLTGANVSLSGIGDFSESNEQFNFTLNSNSLGLGFFVLTIIAQLQNYTTQTFQLFVEVFKIATEFKLLINGTQKFENDVIQMEVFEYINLTAFYLDNNSKNHLSGAAITILSIGNFSEIGNQYNFSLDSRDLSLGFNVITINAQLDTYETQTIQFFIEIFERDSDIQLLVNNIQTNASNIIQVEVNQFLNLTLFYNDNLTKLNLPGASVELINWGNFTEISNQYNYTVDTNDLEQRITILTVQAQLINYKSQAIQFYVKVVERETEIQLYVNSVQTNESDVVKIELNQFLNVTLIYKDNLTKLSIPGAIVQLIGWGNLSEINNQYNFTIDTNDLDQRITILTVRAQLTNYKSQSIRFYVEVFERSSKIQLFLNSEDKTIDPVFELPIRSNLNVTLRFSDNVSGFHIYNASVFLEGTSILLNLTEDLSFMQYTFNIDTTILNIGVNLMKITAYKPNFVIQDINLRITINKIGTEISTVSGDSYISINPGQIANLRIILNDTDFGGTIKGAIVTYTWAYGQGNLTDLNDDGIYEAVLENIPVGVYSITISASGVDDYNFGNYKITLSVNQPVTPSGQTWLVYLLITAIVGASGGFAAYQLHFKYPPLIRKIRKLRKKIKKGRKSKPLFLSNRVETINNALKTQTKILDLVISKIEDKNPNKIEKL
ncbi:hypothetical protein LCGC14_0924010 [marine sediment metagenome]|uniref:Uncharacterized protein n=1 Tax=marine sediment metagenome TaxID=412755 RepID=A0A0F9NUQ9_9ZZZZ